MSGARAAPAGRAASSSAVGRDPGTTPPARLPPTGPGGAAGRTERPAPGGARRSAQERWAQRMPRMSFRMGLATRSITTPSTMVIAPMVPKYPTSFSRE